MSCGLKGSGQYVTSRCIRVVLVAAAMLCLLAGLASAASFEDATSILVPGGFYEGPTACGDYDGDGDVDLYTGGGIYRNDGGTFTKVLAGHIPDSFGPGIFGDYDNDGYLDVYTWQTDYVFKNLSGGGFSGALVLDSPVTDPDYMQSGNWADHNGDGYLDIYASAAGWPAPYLPDAMFRNSGGASFTRNWTESGYIKPGRGVTACDFDEDGDIDIYVSNYRLETNFLWLNSGTGGFTDAASTYGVSGGNAFSIGSAWGDIDNDGHFDLFVGNFAHPGQADPESKFYRNLGPSGGYRFEDKTATASIPGGVAYASPTLGDYDNDGNLDLFLSTADGYSNTPVLFRGDGQWHFTDVTAAEGLSALGSTYQAAWADIDNDGDLDLIADGKIMRNTGNANHWLKVRLRGDGQAVNTAAIGAQVRIALPNGKTISRQVEGSTGEGNQNDLTLHFGLGGFSGPVDVDVFWPNAAEQQVQAVAVDQLVVINYDPNGAGTTLGPELVVNGTFETDAAGWNVYQGSWTGADGDPDPGCVATDLGDANAYILQYVDVEAGKTYKFSYRFMSPEAGAGVIWAYPWIRFEDGAGSPVDGDFTYGGQTTTASFYYVPDGDHLEARSSWQMHELEVRAGAGATKFRIQFAVSDPREFRFDSFSLREVLSGPSGPTTCQEVLDLGYGKSADLNSDCYVNWQDFTLFANQWLACIDPGNPNCNHPWE